MDEPHIIPMFEAGESDGVLFIAMRYVAGGDVRSLVAREGSLSVEETAAILVAVGSALDAAHAAGLVHRDVKPANMLMDVRNGRRGHVYLADFGLTKAAAASVTLTRSGIFLGTADYAAPEQIGGVRFDGRADQYALACAAVEMLTGRPPFPFDQVMDILTAHTHQPAPPVSARRPDLPEALDAVLGRALAKSPDDRYGSCGQFSAAFLTAARIGRNDAPAPVETLYRPAPRLTADLDGSGLGAVRNKPVITKSLDLPSESEPAGLARAARGRRFSGRWVAGAAAAALVGGGVAAYLALAHTGTPPAAASGHRAATRTAGFGHRAAARTTSTPGWHTYADPGVFSISLPPGWAVTRGAPAGELLFTGTPRGFTVVVGWTHAPKPDALAEWLQLSQEKEAKDTSYRPISISQVTYRAYDAADWQFTDSDQGGPTRYIDRGFVVERGRLGYAIELYGPAGLWPAVYPSIWQGLVTSFQPAS